MMIRAILIFYLLLFTLIFTSCGTSTGSRYEKDEEETEEKEEEKVKDFTEDFDITPYRTKLEVEEIKIDAEQKELDVWYNYEEADDSTSDNKEIVRTAAGFRVQVIATDDLEEANNIRSEIYFKTNQKAVYLDFDPPFYKVKVGDFINVSDANEFNFKLTQMGYAESRVINETINIFQ